MSNGESARSARAAKAVSVLVGFERDGTAEAMPLGQWLVWAEDYLRHLSTDIGDLKDRSAEVGALSHRSDLIDLRVAELDSRFNDVLAKVEDLAVGGRQ